MQLASDGIFSSAAAPFSLPAHVPVRIGVAIYSQIEKIAPAPYVEAMLAQAGLDSRDLAAAQLHAERLPASPARDELLGKIAAARGDEKAAQQHFIAAADVLAIRNEVNRLAKRDPAEAYALQVRMRDRLAQTATHPDALAEAYWRLGRLATDRAYADKAHSREWFQKGLNDYAQAVALAPLSEKYLIAAGVQALHVGDAARAHAFFKRATDENPASADAYAGLGVAALRMGDEVSARAYAQLSREYNPHSHFLQTLEKQLK